MSAVTGLKHILSQVSGTVVYGHTCSFLQSCFSKQNYVVASSCFEKKRTQRASVLLECSALLQYSRMWAPQDGSQLPREAMLLPTARPPSNAAHSEAPFVSVQHMLLFTYS